MSERRFFFNGVDGATGEYLLPPMNAAGVLDLALKEKPDSVLLQLLKDRLDRELGIGQEAKRIVEGNAENLAETGWGVIFAPDVSNRARSELSRLLDYRKEQALEGRKGDHYFREFTYRPGETAKDFLRRNGVRPDAAADPDRGVPYYLLLVGDPRSLPYRFQFELDVNYGVGRIHFDKPQDYRTYADSVIAAEARSRLPRQVTFFGVKNEGDLSTERTTDELIEPLSRGLLGPKMEGWTVDARVGSDATREQLAHLLGGKETPALLFTASHGLRFAPDDDRQLARQGALLCQDWRPGSEEGLLREHYFTAEDLTDDAKVQGLIAFLFACYSAGTPDLDSFYDPKALVARRIAQHPFVSRLCQRLLSHPNGGALAVVGHVDRAWTSSFDGSAKGEGADNYRNSLRRLLEGHRVGWAMEHFNLAHATLATKVTNLLEDQHNLGEEDLDELAEAWLESNDARNFVVFGDPAVKLAAGKDPGRSVSSNGRDGRKGIELQDMGGLSRGRRANSDMPPPDVPPDRPPSKPETKPERTTAENRRLRFAAYYPPQLASSSWSTLLAYFGSEGSLGEVEEDSQRRLESVKVRSSRRSLGRASRDVRPGQRITIIPELQGCRFNPEWVSIDWLEDFHCAEFRLQLKEESITDLQGCDLAGSVGYYVGPILLGEAHLLMGTSGRTEDDAPPKKTLASPYESIFISYSRQDDVLVAAFEKAYRALGFETMRDVNFLRSGEDWQERLEEGIESANIFQLYWSHFAKESEPVAREWRHALNLQRDNFIRPVCWEDPIPDPPSELAKIHFHRIVL